MTLTSILFFIVGLLVGAIGAASLVFHWWKEYHDEQQRQASINAKLKRHGWDHKYKA